MKIKEVHIKNFRSIKDSSVVGLDEKISVFIGKNESGKTNFLKALESFNSDYDYSPEDLCNYCGAREKLDDKKIGPSEIEIIKIIFRIEKTDLPLLEKINTKLVKIKTIEISKYFDNHFMLKSPECNLKKILDEQNELELRLTLEEMATVANEIQKILENHVTRYPPFSTNSDKIKSLFNNFYSAEIKRKKDAISQLRILMKKIDELSYMNGTIISEIKPKKEIITGIINSLLERNSVLDDILELRPRFIYFSSTIDLLQDSVKIDEFRKKREKFKTFDRLTRLTGLDVDKLKTANLHRRRLVTNRASTKISGLVNEHWTQEKVQVNIGIDGADITVFVEDEAGALADPPSKRSEGFQWFLSFYINFTANAPELTNSVLLLDTPGHVLHAGGQRDLLRTLEKISDNNQIVFVTHSPFLIDRERLDRVKIVLKKSDRVGTKIQQKIHHSDFDSFEPIRASIGMTLGNSLFGKKKNVVVEGFSDYFIVLALSNYLERIKKNYLNFKKFAIIPVGGADKMSYFALLLEKEELVQVIVLDNDTEGRKSYKELTERYSMNENSIITLNKVLPDELQGQDVEIEDLIDEKFYNNAVNEAYCEILASKNKNEIKISDLKATINKQTLKYIGYFKENKLGKFDKVIVAKQIFNITLDKNCRNEIIGEKTLEYFDTLFSQINKKT